jgi:hypothetical protein
MRSALVLALLLAACATPAGRSVGDCDASWRDVESVVVRPGSGGTKTETVPIDCMRRVDQKRVRIGFSMPPGPACYTLSGVDVVEAADAVSIALWVTAIADPAAGACPGKRPEPPPRSTSRRPSPIARCSTGARPTDRRLGAASVARVPSAA